MRAAAEKAPGAARYAAARLVVVIAVIGFAGCAGQGERPQEPSARRTLTEGEQPRERPEAAQRDLRAFVAVEDRDEVVILPDRVTILRAADGEVVAQPRIAGSPHDVDFTPDGDRLWVAAEGGRRLVKLSVPQGRTVLERRATGGPHDLAVSPSGRELWVTLGRVPTVEVRSAGDGRLLGRPDLGGAPHDLAFQPGGGRIWFSNWTSGRLTVVSVARRAVLERVPAGDVPHHFSFGPRCLWVSDHADGSVVRFASEVTERVDVGAGPHGIALGGGGTRTARGDGDCP